MVSEGGEVSAGIRHRDFDVQRYTAAGLIRAGGVTARMLGQTQSPRNVAVAMLGLSEAIDAAHRKGIRAVRKLRLQHSDRMDEMTRRVHHLNSIIDKLEYDAERHKRECLNVHRRTRTVLVSVIEGSGVCADCVDVLFGHLTALQCRTPTCPGVLGDLAASYVDVAREVIALERVLKVKIAERWCMGRLSKSTREEREAVVEGQGSQDLMRWRSK